MVRARLLPALVLAACGAPNPDTTPRTATAPVESNPVRPPWPRESPPAGPGHLEGAGITARAKVSSLQRLLPEAPWLDVLEPNSQVTATLARPIGGALHHRLHGVLRPGTDWPAAEDRATPCPSLGPLRCVEVPWGKAYVRTSGRDLTVDLITHGDTTESAVLTATQALTAPTSASPLHGDVIVRTENAVRTAPGAEGHVPAFDQGSAEFVVGPSSLRARLRWTPPKPWSPRTSDLSGPSWDALCSGAVACARTGPWPNIYGWLQSLDGPGPPQDPALAAVSLWSSTWPYELAASIAAFRDRSPEVSRGFIDMALSGLGEVEFAGARLDAGGVFVAFVRIPASWVNFTASVLPYAGLTPSPRRVGSTEVTWAPLQPGGLVLALDDGPNPEMGWVVFASSPERFTWLVDAPRTLVPPSGLTARVARLGDIAPSLPSPMRGWFAPYGDRTATLWAEVETGRLSLSIDLDVQP